MKSLIIVLALTLGSTAFAADSVTTLNQCIKKAVSVPVPSEAKEYSKVIAEGIRDCKESVRDLVAAEREAKKKAANAKRIERLQKQLAKLTK